MPAKSWLPRFRVLALVLCGAVALWLGSWRAEAIAEPAPSSTSPVVLRVIVDGGITDATAEYLTAAIGEAERSGASALVIQIDTPGGLLDASRRIVRDILAARVPVIAYVAPAGARAGSAGLFLVLASHVAAMVETSNLGAAHPVSAFGGNVEGDMGNKILNDTAAWARSLAELRGRNVGWAEKAVKESASITAKEALEMNVIDVLAADSSALLQALDGRQVTLGQETRRLVTRGAVIREYERTQSQRLYDFLSDPSLLYVLLLLGIAGLYIEYHHPGLIVPGVLGVVCLGIVLGLQVLPINWLGAGLILLAALLFLAEVYVTSFGALGIAGLASLISGSYLLFSVPGSSFRVEPVLIWSVGSGFAAVLIGFGTLILRVKRQGPTSGPVTLIGAFGDLHEPISQTSSGRVFLDGSYWNAIADAPIAAGARVVVTARDGLTLRVEATEDVRTKPMFKTENP